MEMQKPYDKSALVSELKKQGIDEGIKVASILVSALADWLRSSASLSTEGLLGRFDDFAIPGINYFEKLALEKLQALDAEIDASMAAPAAPEAVVSPEVAVATPVAPVEVPAAIPEAPVAPASDVPPSGGAPA